MTGFRNKFHFCRKRPLNEQCWENQWIQYSHLPAVLALTQTSKNLKVNDFWTPCGGFEILIPGDFQGQSWLVTSSRGVRRDRGNPFFDFCPILF